MGPKAIHVVSHNQCLSQDQLNEWRRIDPFTHLTVITDRSHWEFPFRSGRIDQGSTEFNELQFIDLDVNPSKPTQPGRHVLELGIRYMS